MTVNDQAGLEAAHLRVAELVQGLHNRPDTDSDTVVAELAEHAAAEIPVTMSSPSAVSASHTATADPKETICPVCSKKLPR